MKRYTPKVGIFFKVGTDIIIDAVPLSEGEPYGEAIQYGGHYDFHESHAPSTPHEHRFKAHDYDFYPRGRVVYFPKSSAFVLYTDPCLTPDDLTGASAYSVSMARPSKWPKMNTTAVPTATNPIRNRPSHPIPRH